MNVSCQQCSTVFRIDPAKVPAEGVRARCSACGGVIAIGISAGEAPRRMTPVQAIDDAFANPRQRPGPFMPSAHTPAEPGVSRPTPPTSAAPPVRSPAAQRPAAKTPTPASSRAAVRTPTPPSRPSQGAALPPLRETPRGAAPVTPSRPIQPEAAVSMPAETPPSSLGAPATPQAPVASPSGTAVTPPVAGARRPINPFLARDPSQRAKRLARALVSDMVAYYPAKHSEGLENGTLKELFREEIKKSYDEYVGQVGADFARSTTHFQESLNEVLGAGKKIF